MKTININIFISHAWAYSEHYATLSDWVFQKTWTVGETTLNFYDLSVPKNDPIHNAQNDSQLRAALYQKIAISNVIVIPTGMYANYSKWIQKEIDGAAMHNKPILAVNPWGSIRQSSVVAGAAKQTVGWTSKSVVTGIWELYKNG